MQFDAISPQWRSNTSIDKVTDIASALHSLRFIIGEIDPSKAIIDFNNKARSYTQGSPTGTNEHSIMIDPTPAMQDNVFPIPPANFDILVGYAIHEACHALASSHDLLLSSNNDAPRRHVIRILSGMLPATTTERTTFIEQLLGYYTSIQTIGEEVYVDNLANRLNGMYYQYIHRARMNDRPNTVEDNIWNDPFRAWKLTGFYGIQPPDGCPMFVQKCLALFADVQSFLVSGDHTVKERCIAYATAAVKYHYLKVSNPPITPQLPKPQLPGSLTPPEIQEEVMDNEVKEKNPGNGPKPELEEQEEEDEGEDNANEQEEQETQGNNGEEQSIDATTPVATPDLETNSTIADLELPMHPGGSLTTQLMELVEHAITQEREDITEVIKDAIEASDVLTTIKAGDLTDTNLINMSMNKSTVWELSTEPEDTDFDPDMVTKLRWVERLKNKIAKQPYRGQERGKLDATRVYRGAVDQRIFKITKNRPQQDLELVLLVDASASMEGEGDEIYPHVNALHKAIPSSTVISYTAHANQNKIVVVAVAKGPFHQIDILGGTPSGHALIATAHKYPKALIIHFTDGECNSGVSTRMALDVVNKQYPDVYVVNIEYPNKKTLGTFNNAVVMKLTTLGEFPQVLMEALGHWQPGLKSVLGVKV